MEELTVKIEWGKKGTHFAMDDGTLQFELNEWAMQEGYFEVTDLKTNAKARNWRRVVNQKG
jgi:hypothetical protein